VLGESIRTVNSNGAGDPNQLAGFYVKNLGELIVEYLATIFHVDKLLKSFITLIFIAGYACYARFRNALFLILPAGLEKMSGRRYIM
jgi:hypothetical protein